MKFLNKNYIYLFMFSVIINSCARPIDFEVSDDEKKIVMNGLITPDSLIKVSLSKSLGVLELDGNIDFIEDAEVKLFEGNNFIENIMHTENGYYISTIFPQIGKEYSISANKNQLEEAIGKTILPVPIAISNFEYSYDTLTVYEQWNNPETNESYDTSYLVIDNIITNITFNDPVNEENYYYLTFTALKKVYEYQPQDEIHIFTGIELQSVDFYMGNNISWENRFRLNKEDGYVFSDELFNGNTHTISITDIYLYDLAEPKVYVNFYTIKKEFYNFAVSLYKYEEARYNPLAEPVNIISNIEGGYGFFSGYSVSQDSMIFDLE